MTNAILVVFLFYFLPFFITTILPAILLPFFIQKKLLKKRIYTYSSFLPLSIPFIILPVIANILWELLLFNKVYFEWDRVLLPYNFFFYEKPLLDGTGSWIAKGWNQWNLLGIWIAATLIIYSCAIGSALIYAKVTKKGKTYYKIIYFCIIPFILLSVISIGYHIFILLDGMWK